MADRTIGMLDAESGRGRVGLEASFDKHLAGKGGINLVQDLPHGYRMPVANDMNIRPEAGQDIHTTLDINFQDVAESALKNTLEKFQANYGCVIVMESGHGKNKSHDQPHPQGSEPVCG